MTQLGRHVVIAIGGGSSGSIFSRLVKRNVPEACQWIDVTRVQKQLVPNHNQQNNKLNLHQKVLFGPESFADNPVLQTTTSSIINRAIIYLYIKYAPTKQERKEMKPLYITLGDKQISKNKTIGATKENVQNHILNKDSYLAKCALTKGDRVTFVLSGHGSPYGVLLWNEYLSTSFVTSSMIQTAINQHIPSSVPVTVLVESCYSGSFLSLTSKQTTVFTSSDAFHQSYYNPLEFGWPSRVRWFKTNGSRILDFTKAVNNNKSKEDRINFRAMHSLDWWLNQRLIELSHPMMKKLINAQDCRLSYLKIRHHPLGLYVAEALITGLIIADSTGIGKMYAWSKVLAAAIKMSAPFIKVLLCFAVFKKSILKLLKQCIPNFKNWWSNRFIYQDLKLVASVRQFHNLSTQDCLIDTLYTKGVIRNQYEMNIVRLLGSVASLEKERQIQEGVNYGKSISSVTVDKLLVYLAVISKFQKCKIENKDDFARNQEELWVIAHNVLYGGNKIN